MNRKVRAIARDLIPPVLWRCAGRLRRTLRRGAGVSASGPEWEYICEGWAYAQAHPEVRGWNVDEILAIYRRKWPRFLELIRGTGPLGVAHESALVDAANLVSHNEIMTFGYVLAVASRGRGGISLLDWGGGIGHYYLLAEALYPQLAIDYHCKDVPILAAEGARLFPDGRFYADESCLATHYDLVMASTSLHYAEDWQGVLRGLASAAGRWLYITGLPVVATAPSFVFIQRPYAYGYNTEYLGWCLNRLEFLECAASAGGKLVREFVVGLRPPVQAAPEQPEYRGFLFEMGEAA